MKNIAFALALFVGILWGIAPIFHKVLLRDIGFKTIMVVSSLAYFLCTCIFALVFWKDITTLFTVFVNYIPLDNDLKETLRNMVLTISRKTKPRFSHVFKALLAK